MSKVDTPITLLGQTYVIRCEESETHLLHQTCQKLSEQMSKMQHQGINDSRDVAILAALNICRDHQLNHQNMLSCEVSEKLKVLQADIQRSLEA